MAHDWDTLDRFLAGECSPEEAHAVRVALGDPDGTRLASVLDLLKRDHPHRDHPHREHPRREHPRRDRDLDALFASLHAQTAKAPPLLRIFTARRAHQSPADHQRRAGARWLGAVAVILIVVGAWFARSSTLSTSLEQQRAIQHYRTAPGQRSAVTFASGSTMLLAPATSVAVTPNGIDVTGEAYFTIAPSASRAVVIRMRNATVRVLGTRFVVRQYPEEASSHVMVEEGRVALQHLTLSTQTPTTHSRETILSKDMLARITDSTVTVTSGATTRDYSSWTRGTLVFNWIALSDVAADLARAYGADIRIADTTLAKYKMKIEVSVTEQPLTRVLDLIGKVTDAHYVRDGQAYVITPGRVVMHTPSDAPPRNQFPQPEKLYGR